MEVAVNELLEIDGKPFTGVQASPVALAEQVTQLASRIIILEHALGALLSQLQPQQESYSAESQSPMVGPLAQPPLAPPLDL